MNLLENLICKRDSYLFYIDVLFLIFFIFLNLNFVLGANLFCMLNENMIKASYHIEL